MGAPAFTSGPWLVHATNRIVVQADGAFASVTVENGKVVGDDADMPKSICLLRDPDAGLSEDETLANGFLIAAAPEMFDLLGWLLGSTALGTEDRAKVHAILAKARGETA